MSGKATLFELKEKAKWSRDPVEKKNAIKELLTYGPNAVPTLEEILNITAYEDVKTACAEAIKVIMASIKEAGQGAAVSDSNPAMTTDNTSSKSQKKKKNRSKKARPNRVKAS